MLCGFFALVPASLSSPSSPSLSVSEPITASSSSWIPSPAHHSGQEPQESGHHPDCGPPLGFSASFEPVFPAHLPWEQIRKRQEGFAEIAVWSDEQFNLATGGEVRKSKRHPRQAAISFTSWVERILGAAGPEDDSRVVARRSKHQLRILQRNLLAIVGLIGKTLTLDGNSFQ